MTSIALIIFVLFGSFDPGCTSTEANRFSVPGGFFSWDLTCSGTCPAPNASGCDKPRSGNLGGVSISWCGCDQKKSSYKTCCETVLREEPGGLYSVQCMHDAALVVGPGVLCDVPVCSALIGTCVIYESGWVDDGAGHMSATIKQCGCED